MIRIFIIIIIVFHISLEFFGLLWVWSLNSFGENMSIFFHASAALVCLISLFDNSKTARNIMFFVVLLTAFSGFVATEIKLYSLGKGLFSEYNSQLNFVIITTVFLYILKILRDRECRGNPPEK